MQANNEPIFPPMRPSTSKTIVNRPSIPYSNDLVKKYTDDDSTVHSMIGKALLLVIGPSKAVLEFDKNYRLSLTVPNIAKYCELANKYLSGLGIKVKSGFLSARWPTW